MVCTLLLLLALSMAPSPAEEAMPSLPALLNAVVARDAQTQRELKRMAYDERVRTERLDASGRVTQHQDLRLIVRPGAKQELEVVSVRGDNLPADPDEAAEQAKGREMQRRQQLHGRIWVRASDDTILRTEATLLHPVEVAWIFASITRLDFHYELPAGGTEYGPAWLETSVEVHAPLIAIRQHQRIDMTGFRPRSMPPVAVVPVRK
jgi:hypothetical protein